MDPVELKSPNRALVVVAHPDDADFGSGGTVAKWIASGVEMHFCVATNGDLGGFDRSIDRKEIPAIRQAEQLAAAAVYGVKSVEFLDFVDGSLEPNIDLRRDLSRVIRKIKPDTIICQSPDRNFARIQASHPDHLAAGEAALRAVYPDARNPFAFPELLEEGLEPHTVGQVLLMAAADFNYVSDVTDFIDKKVAALLEHHSQLPKPEELPNIVKTWANDSAERAGLAPGRSAELFFLVKTA